MALLFDNSSCGLPPIPLLDIPLPDDCERFAALDPIFTCPPIELPLDPQLPYIPPAPCPTVRAAAGTVIVSPGAEPNLEVISLPVGSSECALDLDFLLTLPDVVCATMRAGSGVIELTNNQEPTLDIGWTQLGSGADCEWALELFLSLPNPACPDLKFFTTTEVTRLPGDPALDVTIVPNSSGNIGCPYDLNFNLNLPQQCGTLLANATLELPSGSSASAAFDAVVTQYYPSSLSGGDVTDCLTQLDLYLSIPRRLFQSVNNIQVNRRLSATSQGGEFEQDGAGSNWRFRDTVAAACRKMPAVTYREAPGSSRILRVSDFGFNLPDDALVTGFEICISALAYGADVDSTDAEVVYSSVELGGGASAVAGDEPAESIVIGSPDDLCGLAGPPAASVVNNPAFDLEIVFGFGGTGVASVEVRAVTVRVFYWTFEGTEYETDGSGVGLLSLDEGGGCCDTTGQCGGSGEACAPCDEPDNEKRFAIITTNNCCVDQLSLDFGEEGDDSGRYVLGSLISPMSPDAVDAKNVKIFPSVTLKGFLCKNALVEVVRQDCKHIAVGAGQLEINAVLTTAVQPGFPGLAIILDGECGAAAGSDGIEDGEHEAEVQVHALGCDWFVEGTYVRLGWQYDPCEKTTKLVIVEACCPPGLPDSPFDDND